MGDLVLACQNEVWVVVGPYVEGRLMKVEQK